MREYGFSQTRILPCKEKIYDFVLVPENTGQWKPYSRIFYVVEVSSYILFFPFQSPLIKEIFECPIQFQIALLDIAGISQILQDKMI